MIFFDTNVTRRRLMAGGFTEEQADTAVTVVADVAGQTLVTKADLREAMQGVVIRIGAMMVVAVGVILASMGWFIAVLANPT